MGRLIEGGRALRGDPTAARDRRLTAGAQPPSTLLGGDEPGPFEVSGHDARSPFVIACDHAGRRIPRALGSLGVPPAVLETHVAWDIGAGAVARRLAVALDAFVACQTYSRLVIDCNRPLDALDSIVTKSERVQVPGNVSLASGDAAVRAHAIFQPYHEQLRRELDRRAQLGRPSVFVAMHSFTPVFEDVARPWHVGVLFNRDPRLGEGLLRLLRSESGLVVGCNEPYAANEVSDYSLVNHGERRGIPCVELEIRQDLIADEAGQTAWASRFARLLPAAMDLLRLF